MKNPIFRRRGVTKNQYKGGLPKKRGLESLQIWVVACHKYGGGFLRGIDTPMYTIYLQYI